MAEAALRDYNAASIGLPQKKENSIVLGKHSGKHALEERLAELGFIWTKRAPLCVRGVHKHRTRKKTFTTAICRRWSKATHMLKYCYRLDSFIINTVNKMQATASVVLCRGENRTAAFRWSRAGRRGLYRHQHAGRGGLSSRLFLAFRDRSRRLAGRIRLRVCYQGIVRRRPRASNRRD
jgi:hypothetical protein